MTDWAVGQRAVAHGAYGSYPATVLSVSKTKMAAVIDGRADDQALSFARGTGLQWGGGRWSIDPWSDAAAECCRRTAEELEGRMLRERIRACSMSDSTTLEQLRAADRALRGGT